MPLRRPRIVLTALVAAAFVALVAAPLWGYTIYLKDGSKLVATEKYTVRGNKAIIHLEGGTETMLALTEIDIPRTDSSNGSNLGTAVVIEDGKASDLNKNTAPPPRNATLQDLIKSREAQPASANPPAAPAPVRRPHTEGAPAAAADVVGRSPLRNVDLAEAIRTYIFSRGLASVEVLQGPTAHRPLLVYSTGTEGQVFKAIAASAATLINIRDKRPGEVDSFEIVCRAPDGGNGGRFTMLPAEAQEILAGRMDLPTYFVKYVQF